MDTSSAPLSLRARQQVVIGGGIALALLAGLAIAHGSLLLPAVCATIGVAAALGRGLRGNHIGLLLAFILIGYVVGNRGFAQFTLTARLPLLPAEAMLAWGAVWMALQTAFTRRLPSLFDAVTLCVMLWITLSGFRLYFDLRAHGFYALRDFATVYYGAFFLLARAAAVDPRARDYLHGGWIAALVLLGGLLPLYANFEAWFMTQLTVRGIPLIAIKNDLAGTFAAAGAAYGLVRWWGDPGDRRWWGALTLLCLATAIFLVARAAFVGLILTAVVFLPGGRRRLAACLAATVFGGLIWAAVQVGTSDRRWTDTRIYDVYEHGRSLLDVEGTDRYGGQESSDTGDNTQFRLVWWRLLIERTLDDHPWFGAGWGADISSEFARQYLGLSGYNDFTARSPHNIVLTIFARSGFVGLLPFLAVFVSFALGAWRLRAAAIRAQDDPAAAREAVRASAIACAASVVLISACFGVVLEGPMGAVVAWTLAGTAAGSVIANPASGDESASPTPLPPWQEPPAKGMS